MSKCRAFSEYTSLFIDECDNAIFIGINTGIFTGRIQIDRADTVSFLNLID